MQGISFDISNIGKAALISHAKGTKHVQPEKSMREGLPIQVFLNLTKPTWRTATGSGSASNHSTVATATQSTFNIIPAPIVTRTSAAEVRLALKVADTHCTISVEVLEVYF